MVDDNDDQTNLSLIPRSPVGGGLRLPKVVGAGLAKENATHQRWGTLDRVHDRLAEWKVPEGVEPSIECPQLTAELLLTPDPKVYTTAFSHIRWWYGYANRLLARANAELLQIDNEMEDLQAELLKKFKEQNANLPKPQKMSAKEIDAEVVTDLRYREVKLAQQEVMQTKILLAAWVDDLDRALKLISRQVELRKEDNEAAKREQGMPVREKYPQGSFGGQRY